jgi:hypothetical protein
MRKTFMKAPLALSIVVTLAASPAFADCVPPLNEVKIPNGNRATMEQILAANHEMQEHTTEVDAYGQCLKAEQRAKIEAIGPDITDEQKSKIASEYLNRQNAEIEKLQTLNDQYSVAVRDFRAKQAVQKAAEENNEQTAAVNAAEQDAAEKSREDASAVKADEGAKTPKVPKSH